MFQVKLYLTIISFMFFISSCRISSFKTSFKVSVIGPKLKMSSSNPIIVENAQVVRQRIENAAVKSNRSPSAITLVAVSKTKPVEDIKTLYDAGQRHFGENYFQEIEEKCPQLPQDINWHFIGHLQSSKASKIIKEIPNLYMLETIDSVKLADKLQNACSQYRSNPLKVLIQVDTSGEDTKSGISGEEELFSIVMHIKEKCPNLNFSGLMTIGAPGDLTCFDKLVNVRNSIAEKLGVIPDSLELSMGMSGDFEDAVLRGATSVRIGSTIFGPRIYHK